MNIKPSLLIVFFFLCCSVAKSQSDPYVIKKMPFSSNRNDEFSPIFYKNGLVFGSNKGRSSLVNYSGNTGKELVSLFFVQQGSNGKWKRPKILSKDLTTRFNDGPATFNERGDMIYYSRNMFIIKNRRKNPFYQNKLGLYSAILEGKKWVNITPFRHNNDWFNITTPYLSPDGKRLYFSSDKPDGFGGADLYYCEWQNGYWGEPVNLGSEINTDQNEAYPFMNQAGELFFSSDGHPGLGGKDIFVTKAKGNGWYTPIRLAAPINSIHDDFGIVTDTLMHSGYFSSNRDQTIDIYSFDAQKHPIWFASAQKSNNYCVVFDDKASIQVDTLIFQYEWDFGNGIKKYGKSVNHCFEKTGNFTVNVNIIDRRTKEMFFSLSTYQVEIIDIEQPFISSKDYAVAGEVIRLDALKTNFPRHEVKDFYWQFNDTTFEQGAQTTHRYDKEGVNRVKLAVTLQSRATGEISKQAVSKEIHVFASENLKDKFLNELDTTVSLPMASTDTSNYRIKTIYEADVNAENENIFRLQLLSSDKRIPLESTVFKSVPKKYEIRELFDAKDRTYAYIIDEQAQLISIYPAYKDLKASGFTSAQITYSPLVDPIQKELFRLSQKYSLQLDDFFNDRSVLMTNGILMLNKIVEMMNKYPDVNIGVNVHTDNIESTSQNIILSQSLANIITDYLVSSGINKNRLVPKGKGDIFPIRSNMLNDGRKINRRVEFVILQ